MRIKKSSFIWLLLVFLEVSPVLRAQTDSTPSREYAIKAAFLYNLTKFVDWPDNKVADSNDSLVIGIIGKDSFGSAFEPIQDKRVKNKKLLIKRFERLSQLRSHNEPDQNKLRQSVETWQRCHLLFVCASEKNEFTDILKSVAGHGVLTVGEIENFVDGGGIINFIPNKEKAVFEANLIAVKEARLRISSEVLRLAKRVIKEEPVDSNNK